MFKKSTPSELIKKEEDLRFKYTQPGEFANSNHPEVISFAHDVIKNLSNEHEIKYPAPFLVEAYKCRFSHAVPPAV